MAQSQTKTNCINFKIAREFLNSNDWPTKLSDSRFDRCYCTSCYSSKFEDTFTVAGGTYVVPRGYTRFGVRIDEAYADHLNIWEDWLNCYHGTSIKSAKSIIEHRMLLLPGEETMEGKSISIRPGHIPGEVAFFTTPSIKYAELPAYASTYKFKAADKKMYNITVVLQCKQKPNSFRVQGETVGAGGKRISLFIKNNAMEWKSNSRASIIPYGMLMLVQPVGRREELYKRVDCPHCHHLNNWANHENNQGVVLTCTSQGCKRKFKPYSCPHCSHSNAICSCNKQFENEALYACKNKKCKKNIFMSKCPKCNDGFNFCKIPDDNQATQVKCTGKTCKTDYLAIACPHCDALESWKGAKQPDGVIITCKRKCGDQCKGTCSDSCSKKYQLASCPKCLLVNVCENAYKRVGRDGVINCAYNDCKHRFVQPLKERIRRS